MVNWWIDLIVLAVVFSLTGLTGFIPKLIKAVRNLQYIKSIRKQEKVIKSISSEYDDYEDDFYALELEKNELELNRLKLASSETIDKLTTKTATTPFESSKVNFLINAVSLVVSFQAYFFINFSSSYHQLFALNSFQLCLSVLIAPILISLLFVPFLWKLKAKSIYEYIDDKFEETGSKFVKCLLIFIVSLFQLIFGSILIYSFSLHVVQLISNDLNFIQLWQCILLIGICSCLLAMLGIKSIIWANFFQYSIIIICFLIIISIGFTTNTNLDWNKQLNSLINLNENNNNSHYTLWNCLFGLVFSQIPAYCLTQQSYQRIKQAKSLKSARFLILTIIPIGFVNFLLIFLTGYIFKSRSIYEFLTSFTGLIGLYLAALLNCCIGTLASVLKGLSVILIEDVFSRFQNNNNKEKTLNTINNNNTRLLVKRQSNTDYSYEKELLNLKVNWNPNRKKKKILKKYAIKHSKKLANKNLGLTLTFLTSLIMMSLALGLSYMPANITRHAYELLNIFNGPLLFIFVCARFNHFSLKRNHFALNTRSTTSKLKDIRIHYFDLIISCIVSILCVSILFSFKLMYNLKNDETIINQMNYSNITNNNTMTQLNDSIKFIQISYNWYSMIGFLICFINLFVFILIRLIFTCLFSCSKKRYRIRK